MTTELMFTVVPLDGLYPSDTVKASVVVSPRLRGGDRLGDYPGSMLRWTRLVQEQGLAFELQAGSARSRIEVNRETLQPGLWEALFTETTPVNDYRFDQTLVDRANRGVASFSMRETLSLIKAIYREASVELALPDDGRFRRNDVGNRGILQRLIGDLAVHWGGDKEANALRRKHLTRLDMENANMVGSGGESELTARTDRIARLARAVNGRSLYDDEGYFVDAATKNLSSDDRHNIAAGCMAFHHMPTPAYADEDAPPDSPPKSNLGYDPERVIDFHQALSALGNYPSLSRALGLVFDVELPIDALEPTPGTTPHFLQIRGHSLDGDFSASNGALRTAYRLLDAGPPGRLFHTGSRFGPARGLLGLAALDPAWFGIAQVDVDGAMHKTVLLAESLEAGPSGGKPALAAHPEVYDAGATLPALRSGGLSLYADLRAMTWLAGLNQSAATNAAFEQGQAVDLYAEDITRGLRLDVRDDRSERWYSLHERSALYRFYTEDNQAIPDAELDPRQAGFDPALEEGWVESAVTRPAPGTPQSEDHYYLHEAFARWAGWSLSAPRPDLALAADPTRRDPEPDKEADAPTSPFKIKVDHRVRPGSLPALRFGRRYRLRGRWVNLAGLSACINDPEGVEACVGNPVGDGLSQLFALPTLGRDGLMYRRFEPVASPQIVVDDTDAIVGPGSTLHRLVIRTDNRTAGEDAATADTRASSRHLLPPRVSVEMAERMGMFDDVNGRLMADAATWQLIGARDGSPPGVTPVTGELPHVEGVPVAGEPKTFPLIADAFLAELPYLPDAYARGVALRDLPGTPWGALARIDALTSTGAVEFERLTDPNPRPGSALLISFGGGSHWKTMQGVRLALAEPVAASSDTPHWNAETRTLTVFLAKGRRTITPISCYLLPTDLSVMGVWQWFQEEAAARLRQDARPPTLAPGQAVDELAHILQRTVEGGHWMLTPPVLLELVHALRQPLGDPAFQPLAVRKGLGRGKKPTARPLQTALTAAERVPGATQPPARRDPDELAALTGWRQLASTDAYLLGALRVHGVATGRIDLVAEWSDPVDDPVKVPLGTGDMREMRRSSVERIDLPRLREGYLPASDTSPPDIDDRFADARDDANLRYVGYYDPEHDQIAFVQPGDASLPSESVLEFDRVAAPRHAIGDTRHHRIRYQGVAVSRDVDCFAPPGEGEAGFTRVSAPVEVSIPASSRPLAPEIAYVLPAFGWQRQTDTGIKRSVRYGGGLRVYLKRPWFSSGEGELLGIALWQGGSLDQADRDRCKPYLTQWGMDPIWQTSPRFGAPSRDDFPDRLAEARDVSLDEITDLRVDVAGYPVTFDPERQLWYADLTLDAGDTYAPFVRLALARYQPDALPDARLSRVVLADFTQLTPGRAVVVHPHPARANTLRVQVSGIAPTGPKAVIQTSTLPLPPTRFGLRLQERIAGLGSELGWRDVALPQVDLAKMQSCGLGVSGEELALFVASDGTAAQPNLALWEGFVCFSETPQPGRYRFLIEEYESIGNDAPPEADSRDAPGRLIFAEVIHLDTTLLTGRTQDTALPP